VDIKSLLTREKGKEVSVAAAKGSVPAAIATALLSGVSMYLGIDLDVESLIGIFFGAGIGSVIGQFQKNPKEVLLRFKGMFGSKPTASVRKNTKKSK
tara:strand:- start:18 stop:308 length:291 start_codon:yes stop_codon:yes gene_type:complete